ncbi:MAG: glucosaminidase domain-containing protein [Rhodospirillales bacterium]|nr:glucosaminidase domain-containing protein [Rhodospirillales bacterium]
MARKEYFKALVLGIVLTLLALAAVMFPVREEHTLVDLDSVPGYDLDRVRRTGLVVAPFIDAIAVDFGNITDNKERKAAFLRILLPLVIRENQRLLLLRETVRRSPDTAAKELGPRFGVDDGNRETLLRRIDIIPVSLALAQAAVESGWGTSRFVREGNSFFGERTFNSDDPGIKPRDADGSFRVLGFASISHSVQSYMYNLNTHPAYAALRRAREKSRREHGAPRGGDLVPHLSVYAEDREAYVKSVGRVMAQNRLGEFDGARLVGW